MECLLHYCWKHGMLPLSGLCSTRGERVDVISPGLHNHGAGPDFLMAKVRIDGLLWAGSVEIHTRSSDWYRHHHDTDRAYSNVILHVVEHSDKSVRLPGSQEGIPEVEIPVPRQVREHYSELAASDTTPRCAHVLSGLPPLTVSGWLAALAAERLAQRTEQIEGWREQMGMDWESTLFVAVARCFGFGVNGETFEAWAKTLPASALTKHRDDLFQMEALFFGQAGLLSASAPPKAHGSAEPAPFMKRLAGEYAYLRTLFDLTPIDSSRWKFLRLRPQNFPHVRLAQLAALHHARRLSLSAVVGAKTVKELRALLDVSVSPFWQTHYTFRSAATTPTEKRLSMKSRDLLVVNALAPVAFAYGRHRGEEGLCERALGWLDELKAEDNLIVRQWTAAGITPHSAAESQALLQLTRQYCERRDCLRCRFGHEFIRQTPGFLHEPTQNEE